MRSDNTLEYKTSQQLQNFSPSNGILFHTSYANTPQENGVAERKNRHLLKVMKAMFQINAPKPFREDVVLTVCNLINKMPSNILDNNTSFHVLFPS